MQKAIANFEVMPAERHVAERLAQFQEPASRLNTADLRVAIHRETNAIREDWKKLEAADANALYQTIEWCESWFEATQANPLIVTVSLRYEPVLILPLEVKPTLLGPVAVFAGSAHSNVNTGLLAPEFARHATPDLMATIVRRIKKAVRGHVSLILLSNMPDEWMGVSNPFRQFLKVENQNHAYQLPLIGSFEDTLAQINAKRRRKKYRKSVRLLDDAGGFEHVVGRTDLETEQLLSTFFAQKRVRFEAAGLPDVFAPQDIQSFFRTITRQSSPDGNYLLRVHALRLNDGRIAAVAGLSRKGAHIVCQFSSIDEDVAPEASPGELLFYLMIEEAHKAGATVFDFGLGYQRYKSSWCPVETVHYDILIPLGISGWMAAAKTAITTRAIAFVKQHQSFYAFLQRWRAQ